MLTKSVVSTLPTLLGSALPLLTTMLSVSLSVLITQYYSCRSCHAVIFFRILHWLDHGGKNSLKSGSQFLAYQIFRGFIT